MRELRSHAYRGKVDLDALSAFARAATRARWPGVSPWHVGDVAWMLSSARHDGFEPTDDVRLWTADADVVGVGWFYDPLHVRTDVDPALDAQDVAFDAILDWAEDRALAAGAPLLTTLALDGHALHRAALARRGYAPMDRGGVWMRRGLDALPPPELPPGFRFRDGREFGLDERAAVHRDAWSHLEHLGMADARSGFTTALTRRARSPPAYDPELDLAVEDADGTLAGCCTAWIDVGNRLGLIEPMGVAAAHRGRRLARALNLEAMRRLRGRGAAWAGIGTADFNHAAQATYRSCGFETVEEDRWYRKPC